MLNFDELIHLAGTEITSIHDSILEDNPGLKGTRSDLSIEALVGRVQSNLVYQAVQSLEEVAAL